MSICNFDYKFIKIQATHPEEPTVPPGTEIKAQRVQAFFVFYVFLTAVASRSCPYVSGAASLLWNSQPTTSWKQIKAALMSSVTVTPELTAMCESGVRGRQGQ